MSVNIEEKNKFIEKANTKIFKNILCAILIMLYFVGTYVAYIIFTDEAFERILQAVTMALLAISIIPHVSIMVRRRFSL